GEEDAGAGGGGAALDDLEQTLGEVHLGGGGEEVRHVAEGAELGRDGRDERRVGGSQGVDGDAAEQVEVARAVGVPHPGSLAADEDALRGPEGVPQRVAVALGDRKST